MISRTGGKGFFAAHYDWLLLAVGVIALGAGIAIYISALGEDPDMAAAEAVANVDRLKPSKSGVAPLDMAELDLAYSLLDRQRPQLPEVAADAESFLTSEFRVLCQIKDESGKVCGKAISGDVRQVPECPYCHKKRKQEKVPVADSDGDGLPDEWEKKYGLNVNDAADANADLDRDDFTNLEEYVAKTDPTDPKDHPDYLDSLKVELPLKETFLPFVFRKANKIPAGWRCEFFDPARRDDYGRRGTTLTAVIGEEIANTGFVLKSHVAKSVKQTIKGSDLTKPVDVSEVVVERKTDGKKITLTVQQGKSVKLAPVDVQVTLVYMRGAVRRFVVVPGTEIVLSGTKYKVVEIKAAGKGAKVRVRNVLTGRDRTIDALE